MVNLYATPHAAPTGENPNTYGAWPGSGEVSLSWDPPARDGGSPIVGYEVNYRVKAPGEGFVGWSDIPGGAGVLAAA